MQLTPMQLFCQKKLILAAYPGLSLEEAKKKELGYGCFVGTYNIVIAFCLDSTNARNKGKRRMVDGTHRSTDQCIKEKIIGLPPCLARVLNCLETVFGANFSIKYTSGGKLMIFESKGKKSKYIFTRKLLNEDGTDATLRDQSEETQNTIALLLGYNDV